MAGIQLPIGPYAREDLFDIKVTITAVNPQQTNTVTNSNTWSGTFDGLSGGDVQVKDTKYRPANGSQAQISLGGPREYSDVKVMRLFDSTWSQIEKWVAGVTGQASIVIAKQPLQADGTPFGQALTYTGTLVDYVPAQADSNNESAAKIELTASVISIA